MHRAPSHIRRLLIATALEGVLMAAALGLGPQAAHALPNRDCQSTYIAQMNTWRSAETSWAIAASLEEEGSDAYFYDMSQSTAAGRQFNRAANALIWC